MRISLSVLILGLAIPLSLFSDHVAGDIPSITSQEIPTSKSLFNRLMQSQFVQDAGLTRQFVHGLSLGIFRYLGSDNLFMAEIAREVCRGGLATVGGDTIANEATTFFDRCMGVRRVVKSRFRQMLQYPAEKLSAVITPGATYALDRPSRMLYRAIAPQLLKRSFQFFFVWLFEMIVQMYIAGIAPVEYLLFGVITGTTSDDD